MFFKIQLIIKERNKELGVFHPIAIGLKCTQRIFSRYFLKNCIFKKIQRYHTLNKLWNHNLIKSFFLKRIMFNKVILKRIPNYL